MPTPPSLWAACAALATLSVVPAQGSAQSPNPVELGDVNWSRDYAAAQKEARSKNLPLLILFQEVPG